MKPDLDNFERKLLRRILEESTSTVIAHEFGIPKEVVYVLTPPPVVWVNMSWAAGSISAG